MIHQPRKRFGQNFLRDGSIIAEILAHAQPQPNQRWLEIGPGLGALTEPLLATGVCLDVVELDRDLVAHLRKKFAHYSNLTIHSADALKFDFAALIEPGQTLRVIGNLPYNISTPLMFHLLENSVVIEDMHFMLQKEVVDRLCADAGGKKYGRLSVMMQYFCSSEWLFDVPPESFDPPPQVMSAIVRLEPYRQLPVRVDDFQVFSHLVTQAFSQRRKTLRNSLKTLLNNEQIEQLGIDGNLRAEAITLEEFAVLSNFMTSVG